MKHLFQRLFPGVFRLIERRRLERIAREARFAELREYLEEELLGGMYVDWLKKTKG